MIFFKLICNVPMCMVRVTVFLIVTNQQTVQNLLFPQRNIILKGNKTKGTKVSLKNNNNTILYF